MKSGIYICECMISDGIYIGKTGSTVGFEKRWRTERWGLIGNKCHNKHWQNGWNKYGDNNYEWKIVEECCDEVINQREIAWIKYYREQGRNVYNFTNGGEGSSGYRPSEETRKKLSEARMGNKNHNYGKHFSEEYRKKLSKAHYGNRHSEETKNKLSVILKGNKRRLGTKQSEETKIKIGKKNKGQKRSEETRKKISAATMGNKNAKGRVVSKETKIKIGTANKGTKRSEECKRKMSEARKKYWFNKKITKAQTN